MPLRLMEIFLPENDTGTINELFENETTLDYWQEETSDGSLLIKLLISADKTEKILDRLEEKYSKRDGFRDPAARRSDDSTRRRNRGYYQFERR